MEKNVRVCGLSMWTGSKPEELRISHHIWYIIGYICPIIWDQPTIEDLGVSHRFCVGHIPQIRHSPVAWKLIKELPRVSPGLFQWFSLGSKDWNGEVDRPSGPSFETDSWMKGASSR